MTLGLTCSYHPTTHSTLLFKSSCAISLYVLIEISRVVIITILNMLNNNFRQKRALTSSWCRFCFIWGNIYSRP